MARLGRTKDAEGLADPNASPQKKQSAVRDVAAASVLAALEIYDSMEAAALVVTKAGGDATSGYVTHKCAPLPGDRCRLPRESGRQAMDHIAVWGGGLEADCSVPASMPQMCDNGVRKPVRLS